MLDSKAPSYRRLALGVALCLVAERIAWVFAAFMVIGDGWSARGTGAAVALAAFFFVLRRGVAWRMSERVLREEHGGLVEELLSATRGQRFGYEIVERALAARIELARTIPLALGESLAALGFALIARASAGFGYYLLGYALLALLVFLFRTRIHAWSIAQSELYLPVLERIEWITRAQEEIVGNGSIPWVRARFAEGVERWRRETFKIDAWLMIVSRWPLAVFGAAVALSVTFFDASRGSATWVFSAAALGAAASAISLWLLIARARGKANLPMWAPREPVSSPIPSHDAIRFSDVAFAFPAADKQVLDGLTFQVRPGEIAVLVGENGSGKSTVLRLAAGLLLPSAGSVESACMGTASTAYFPQRSELIDGAIPDVSWDLLGVSGEMAMPLFAHPTGQAIATMSGGERKKYLLNRLFAAPGKGVYLLDEPDAALDDASVELLAHALVDRKVGAVILVSTHHPRIIAAADHVIDLSAAAAGGLGTKAKLRSAG